MKKLKLVLTVMVSLVSLVVQAQEQEQFNIELTNPGKPYKLKVALITGNIKVSGHAGNDLVVGVTGQEDKRVSQKDKDAGGMKRIGGSSGFELKATEKNNEVEINNTHAIKKVDIELKVPANGTIQLKTINNGVIEVSNVQGELELSNINGAIRITGIKGSAVANTVTGEIIAKFESVTADKPMAFSSLNGKIDVSFPAQMKANLKMKTGFGDIFSDFDVALEKPSAGVVKSNEKGLYKISKDDWMTGKINGGGPDVLLKSNMGNIYLRKGK